ncbi:hypothetical protein HAX54_003089 [Datura stramonium]|uniref:Mediator of RNA polymerase II transcription subunit 15a-like n=1 Tax=Datura stramonium TaxID=4076 RepID=A0ABS8RT86_DATST|nr:hypothetical protein [Datura stramonium]
MYIGDNQGGEGTAPAAGAAVGGLSTRAPLDSTAQMENANGADWQEEIYQKIKSINEMHLSALNDLYQKIVSKVQQGSMAAMQQNNLTNLQYNSLTGLSTISNSLQHMINTLQPASGLDLGQANSVNSLQQVATGSLQQNPVNSPQQANKRSLSSQSGTNPMQANLGSLQQNSNALQQLLPKQQEQQMLQNQQFTPLSNQLLMQEQFVQTRQLMQQQQAKEQQTAQLPTHQISQLHHMTDANDLKTRQQMGMKTGFLQKEQSVGQRVGSHHPQLKSGISSPQLHQALSPQGSMASMQQNNLTNLQHNSLSGVSTISNSQPHMINKVQPGFSLDLGLGNSSNSLQQVATGSLQQNPVNSPQLANISSLSSQSGTNPMQANLGSVQKNSSAPQQSLSEQHEQQMLQNQQLRQQYHQRLMLQQAFQRQQLMQQQTAQLPTHQISQLHHMTDANDLNMRQQMGMKTGVLQQQQSVGQLVGSYHPQLKSEISSPQLHRALSPQRREKRKVEGNATVPMKIEPYTSTVEAPLDSTTQTGNANGTDWQEEVYQKIKSMREMHLSELNHLYQKIAAMVQKHAPPPHHPRHEKIEKLAMFKTTLERILLFLGLNKHDIQLIHKEKLHSVEKNISFFLSTNRLQKPTSSPLQGQLPQPSAHASQAQNTYARQTPAMDSGHNWFSEFH